MTPARPLLEQPKRRVDRAPSLPEVSEAWASRDARASNPPVLRGSLACESVRGGQGQPRPPHRGPPDGHGKERVTHVCTAPQAATNSSKPPTCGTACISTM